MRTTLIRHGTIVTASDRYEADIYCEHGVIALIGRSLSLPADEVIDASGLMVMPGAIDVHTHLDLPVAGTVSADNFFSGTVAAAHGGTTTILDFVTPEPGERLDNALAARQRQAENQAVIDYGFHMVLRTFDDHVAAEMTRLVRHAGVTTFKLFMAYPGSLMVDDGTLLRAMRHAGQIGALTLVHAENGSVIETLVREALACGHTAPRYHALTRPPDTEGEAVHRAIVLASLADAPLYIVHLSSADGLEAIRSARGRGLTVYAETCPQYLFLSDAAYDQDGFEGAKYVMSPPLRPAVHQAALWRGLADGDVQVVATDHCPFSMDNPPQKQRGRDDFSQIPNGVPGIETRPMLLWQGVRDRRISARQFVELVATAPARLFGLWPRKGTIAVGSDADLLVWDPDREVTLRAATLHHRVDYCPYEGLVLRGAPAAVLSRGDLIVDHGVCHAAAGRGRFVPRTAQMPGRSGSAIG